MADTTRLALPLRPSKAQLTDAAWIMDAQGKPVCYCPQPAGAEPGRALAWRDAIIEAVNATMPDRKDGAA